MKKRPVVSESNITRIFPVVLEQLRGKEFQVSAIRARIRAMGFSYNYADILGICVFKRAVREGLLGHFEEDGRNWFYVRD